MIAEAAGDFVTCHAFDSHLAIIPIAGGYMSMAILVFCEVLAFGRPVASGIARKRKSLDPT